MAGKNGGARPGAGRPKGGINKRTAELKLIAQEALAKGVTPVEVMLDNMRFYVDQADKLLAKIVAGKEPTIELVEALKELTSFRSQAQSCAVDAAPYFHPRLAAVTVGGDPNNPLLNFTRIECVVIDERGKIINSLADEIPASLPAPSKARKV